VVHEPSSATPRHRVIEELNATDAFDRLLNALAVRLEFLYDSGKLRCDVRVILNQQDGLAKSPNNRLKGPLARRLLPDRFQAAHRLAFHESSQIQNINAEFLDSAQFPAIYLLQDLLSDIRHPAQQASSSRLRVNKPPPNCMVPPHCSGLRLPAARLNVLMVDVPFCADRLERGHRLREPYQSRKRTVMKSVKIQLISMPVLNRVAIYRRRALHRLR